MTGVRCRYNFFSITATAASIIGSETASCRYYSVSTVAQAIPFDATIRGIFRMPRRYYKSKESLTY